MVDIKLIGSRLNKISAYRNISFSGEVKLKTNLKFNSIEKVKDRKDSLEVKYSFEVDYGDLGNIFLEGSAFISSDPKIIKELSKSWESKKFDSEEHLILTNLIVQKISMKAFALEDELALPTHIRLPQLQIKSRD